MAAPQWSGGKWKTLQEAKAQFGHSVSSRRKEAQHTNPHINKALTPLNWSYRGLSYQGCCAALDKRLGEIDMGRQSSGKNARTLMQSVIVYPPAALVGDPGKLHDWFVEAGKLAEIQFGAANVLEMAVHMDEVHEYKDFKTGETRVSREHAHLWLVPEVDGKLNGKKFSSRQNIMDFNDELQAMTIEKFNCPMMDGSKAKGGRPVEDLKAKSKAAEIIADAKARAADIMDDADMFKQKMMSDIAKDISEGDEIKRQYVHEGLEVLEEAKKLLKTAQSQLDSCTGYLNDEQYHGLLKEQQKQMTRVAEAEQRLAERIAQPVKVGPSGPAY